MIGFIRGKIVDMNPSQVVVDVRDIGYEVRISVQTFSKLKDAEDAFLYTYLMVREDAHTLFGFFEPEEKSIFTALISVNGVGANTALLILSSMAPAELIRTIRSGDHQKLTTVKGIGAKTAQRLVLELKDKIGSMEMDEAHILSDTNTNSTLRTESVEALIQLGISKTMAEKVVDKVMNSQPDLDKIEDVIKTSLQNL